MSNDFGYKVNRRLITSREGAGALHATCDGVHLYRFDAIIVPNLVFTVSILDIKSYAAFRSSIVFDEQYFSSTPNDVSCVGPSG